MIDRVVLRNFKRFENTECVLDSRMVFAGGNNSGKTTIIQAITAWHFAFGAWVKSGRQEKAIGLTRKEFAPVPLREFQQLWTDGRTALKKGEAPGKEPGAPRFLEIELHGNHKSEKWQLAMEFRFANRDQVYVKSKQHGRDIPGGARAVSVVYIPSFAGISVEEHEVNRAYQDTLIGQGKSGDILRNLLQEVHENKAQWDTLCDHVKRLFGYLLAPPSPPGQSFIVCEYRRLLSNGTRSPLLDINTAGSGFQQLLLLLAFIYARPASVLLIDEPDAHLHVNLQGEVLRLLTDIAVEKDVQLIIATHSEALIEATPPKQIVSFLGDEPHRLSDTHERTDLQLAMIRLSSMDLLRAEQSDQ